MECKRHPIHKEIYVTKQGILKKVCFVCAQYLEFCECTKESLREFCKDEYEDRGGKQ